MESRMWTLDELVAQVASQLADGRTGQLSRRVREVPDRRAIRWYTTIGLLDRPLLRGRTGWYGPRHLLQLVAIKRLQAAGRSLAEIQAELAGATETTLRRIARLSPELPDGAPTAPARRGARERVDAREVQARFWTTTPTVSASDGATRSGMQSATGPAVRYALELADGVTLLLDAVPEDLAAVRAAARPLLDHLARRAVPEGEER